MSSRSSGTELIYMQELGEEITRRPPTTELGELVNSTAAQIMTKALLHAKETGKKITKLKVVLVLEP